jgi:GNAT superfamily N-acetyltransferase
MDGLQIRAATGSDLAELLALICELAEYERLSGEVTATEADLRQALFGNPPFAEAWLGCVHGVPVAYAVVFTIFSTFSGKPGLYIEDIYVKPEFRGRGLGLAFMRHLGRLALARGCTRMAWSVLPWNEPALRFYESLGAQRDERWHAYHLSEATLRDLAKGKSC